mgnify:CR=1 FL=1
MRDSIVLATRPSDLARWQTRFILERLQEAWPELDVKMKVIQTRGDREIDKPLPEIGGKGLFTLELEQALLAGEVQGAVHSLKDLPVESSPGLCVGAIPARGDVRDALVSKTGRTLDELPPGARVGTSSLRRKAQLLATRPDLEVVPLRGNVNTRVEKAYQDQYDYDGIVLAAVGLQRLGLDEHIAEVFDWKRIMPAPAQGALAVQSREDQDVLAIFEAVDCLATRRAVHAERVFLQALGGGCAVPVAAYGREVGDGYIALDGLVADVEGGRVIRVEGRRKSPEALGTTLAAEAQEQGALELINA